MAVSSVYGSYGMNISKLYQDAMNEGGSSASGSAGTLGGTGAGLYASVLSSYKGQAALSSALADIKKDTGSERITFTDVENYREKLEDEFSSTVKEDLLKLGVDPDVEFTLVTDSSGKLTVVSSHPDKAKIQKYFDSNPKMAEKFETIQALSNFKKAADSPLVRDWDTMRDIKKGLQAQALEIFFAAAQDAGAGFSSMYADFGADGATNYMLGLNQTV